MESLMQIDAGGILAAGPLSKQPATTAYRVVLRSRIGERTEKSLKNDFGAGFVVHTQYFPKYPSLEGSFFEGGDYFDEKHLVEATRCFAERVTGHAVHLASLYRD